jgi:glycosyltransferase involved in cell wall biosynthesis
VTHADHLITISHAAKADLVRYFQLPDERVSVAHLGPGSGLPQVSPAQAEIRIREQFGLQPGFILCVGSLEPRKNLLAVLEAFLQRPAASRAGRKLVVSGADSWRSQEMRSAISRAGATDDVLMPGHVSDADLAALYATAGVFAFPSLYEGFGFPVLEAMRAGCPVVTSNISSLPEVAGDAAVLVDPRDVDAISRAIWEVADDPALAAALRQRGAAQAALFSWERCARETVDVYFKMLGRPRPGSTDSSGRDSLPASATHGVP